MTHRRTIALLIETSNAYCRGVLDGISKYTQHHDRWSVVLPEQERGAQPPRWMANWNGDGIIARIENSEIAAALREVNCPIVDVSAARHLPEIPWVETDDAEIAKLAVEHFLERGFRNLAFVGDPEFNWSKWRQQHFEQRVREASLKCLVHQSLPRYSVNYSRDGDSALLAKWLKELPRPVGILACYDIKAQQLLDVCRESGIAVPEEIAVLGVDNDELLCQLATPPLSSIDCDTFQTGYLAADLLDRMMDGEQIGPTTVLVKPLGVNTRHSTDILAIDDVEVAMAVHFIRENATAGINVTDVLRAVPLTRRVLENRFKKILGRTPHEEIASVKINSVKRLLRETDLPLAPIASRCGFQHEEYLSVAFKKAVGMPPSQFRRAERG